MAFEDKKQDRALARAWEDKNQDEEHRIHIRGTVGTTINNGRSSESIKDPPIKRTKVEAQDKNEIKIGPLDLDVEQDAEHLYFQELRDKYKRKTNADSWFHYTEIQVAFGEVVGNALYHDDVKMNEDREKILKALANIKAYIYLQKEFFFYSMHWVDGVYLVDR
ncbi:hypothetical protein C1645_828053 [Glomus cerebriforme]|uniref:Uncharacterized protein n=1 Tax=Glomus cerebriforme TaxID=658196 RepID=A0A397STA8_9GLOM|nr:hypothetical protein C1645_828053 [Glomus cerebriforme]